MMNPEEPMTTLTKREYFVAMIAQGLCAHRGDARDAVELADELITALDQEARP